MSVSGQVYDKGIDQTILKLEINKGKKKLVCNLIVNLFLF